MSIKIGSNIASLQAQRRLGEATSSLGKIYERLSSGQRINRASDDAAGLAILSTLNADTKVLGQAIRNINDGISVLNVSQAALSALSDITIRKQELAVQASSETFSNVQRQALNSEAQALTQEYSRIIATTSFNGKSLFSANDSDLSIQAGQESSHILQTALGSSLAVSGAVAAQTEVSTIDFAGTANSGIVEATNFSVATIFDDGFESQVMYFDPFTPINSGEYFTFSFNSNTYSVWYNVDGAGGGAGDIQVDISAMDNAETVAQLTAQAITNFGVPGLVGEYVTDLSPSVRVSSTESGNQNDPATYSAAIGSYVSLDGGPPSYTDDYFSLTDASNNDYYFYYNTDPGISGTGFLISLLDGDSQNDIASKTVTAINSTGLFSATYTGGATFRVNNLEAGNVLNSFAGGGSGAIQFTSNTNGRLLLTNQNYFTFSSEGTDYYAWFNDGVSGNPALAGRTGIEITNVAGGTAFQAQTPELLAQRAKVALDAFFLGTNFTTTVNGSQLAITNTTAGPRTDTALTIAGASLSIRQGSAAVEGAAPSFEPETINLSTVSGAREAMSVLEARRTRIMQEQGLQGAFESRLMVALNVARSTKEQYQASAARIENADVAEEVSKQVRYSILQNIGSAIIAQANQQPALALTLLRG